MSHQPQATSNLDQPSNNSTQGMDEKTRAQYKLDSKKVFIRSLKNGGIVAIIMFILTLLSWDFSKIEGVFLFSFIAFFVSYIILLIRLNTKYKITTAHYDRVSGISSLSAHDSDSTYPGSAAHSARQCFYRIHDRTVKTILHL